MYHDLQSTFIDALFFCCGKAKIYFPDKPLFLVLNGTDPLERIFGVARMKNKNASMDYLTLVQCFASMIKCDEIMTVKHPEWSKKPRSSCRLCLDYSNPKQWNENSLKLKDIDIRALWESGHLKVRAQALESGLLKSGVPIDSLELLGYTQKKPNGKLIGASETGNEPSMGFEVENLTNTGDSQGDSIPFSDLLEKSSTIEVDGKNIYKASVINSLFSTNTLSKDRLKRVQELTADASGHTKKKPDENMIFIGDPLVVHIDKKTHVGNIHTISLGNQNKKCLYIDDFASKNLLFEVKLLNLVEKENCLFWDGTFTGTSQKVISENRVIIKPSVSANPPENLSNFFYDKQFLLDIGVELSLANNLSTSSSRSSNTKQQATTIKKNQCKVCSKPISCEKMRGHIAYHIIKLEIESSVCDFSGLPSCTNKLV